jgi:hypothetical protein
MDRKRRATPEELARQFYALAKAETLAGSSVSPIYPLNLTELLSLEDQGCIEQFLKHVKKLAKRDNLKAVVIRHADLSQRERKELTDMLKFSAHDSVLKKAEGRMDLPNRIYLQLQRQSRGDPAPSR